MSPAKRARIRPRSKSRYLIWPCGKSSGNNPVPSAPGLLNTAPQGNGRSRSQRTSSTSPGSASLTAIGPMTECGPLPGLALRNSASRSIGTPGCISFMKCDQVLGKLMRSPESIVRIGGRVASNTPSCTVSLVDSTVWTRPPPAPPADARGGPPSAAWAILANHGPTAASAHMKLLARSRSRRARPRADR